MSAQSTRSNGDPHWPIPQTTCRICPASDLNFGHLVPARRIIWRGQDLHDVVPFICSGWAATVMALSNGRRQIISFLLPGEIISTTLLCSSQPYCRIEAVTEVHYRVFNRAKLRALLYEQPDLLERFSKTWIGEKARADALIADLVAVRRRSALRA